MLLTLQNQIKNVHLRPFVVVVSDMNRLHAVCNHF